MNSQTMKANEMDTNGDSSVNNSSTDTDVGSNTNIDRHCESAVPTDTALIHLLLAREGDTVTTIPEANGEDDLNEADYGTENLYEVAKITHERELDEKTLKLEQSGEGGMSVQMDVANDSVVVSSQESPDATDTVGSFRVVGRSLDITPETWQQQENEIPIERYREVRLDESARGAIAELVGWLAETIQMDERFGNSAYRKNRDEVLATAYRLQKYKSDGSFTAETVALDIIQSALDTAQRKESEDGESNPFNEMFLAAVDEQIESPGLTEWSGGDEKTGTQ